ncbi:MAG: preprotein translocase subunit SecY [Candidatus Pacebacteria bacterium]|nr:preprotein translocase subunit SecY [Candidatus Paceibacterota bacterium]MDD3072135.1 preprotein translocase subunit SecY [Candidatus Paceibacterota bacterium]MDD3728800.1 preprotein translocase subunit SecY [Candidatus Paceibacterota bacterium]MDD4201341.1 preprotein translocase subunit SecY [Candidatus Paceibacterota bacterium]MDD4467440.1 preprotein translocase subunit SecY [Candidatus Paceibacterota bacterium]
MWYQKIIQIYKIKDLRKKILFILGILAFFRVMASIPMPGIDAQNLKLFFEQFQMFGLLNVFTGGALDRMSIVMLGVGPYITAVIILQLLTMIIPQLEKLYKEEGEAGRKKFNQYGRMLTVPFALVQGYGMLALFQRQNVIPSLDGMTLAVSLLTVTAGTVLLMWLGELISEKGIGNGVSILIFAGIVADFPSNIRQMVFTWDPAMIPSYLIFFALAILIIAGVVLVNEGRRNIPISYAKRVRGMKMYGGASTYLPLNVNPAGVIPIIFALSVVLLPGMLASFFVGKEGMIGAIATGVSSFLSDPWIHNILYFTLVVLFTFFYTAVTFDPKNISGNLQKMGGFIPGIRPGDPTADFIQHILNRVLLFGAIFLGTIAVMPSIVAGITQVGVFNFLIGGTSLLIAVSVVLDTMKQINAQLQMREYETF